MKDARLGTCYYDPAQALARGSPEQRHSARFIADFWRQESLHEVERQLARTPPQRAWAA